MNQKQREFLEIPEQKTNEIAFKSIYVSFHDGKNGQREYLTDEEQNRLEYVLNTSRRKKIIVLLEELVKKYPTQPDLYNLLSYHYILSRKPSKADKITAKNFQLNSNNLLAKINYLDLLLRQKKWDEVTSYIKPKSYITDLEPSRSVFQASEYLAFLCFMGHYHIELKETSIALVYCYLADRIAPKSPQVLFLKNKIKKT